MHKRNLNVQLQQEVNWNLVELPSFLFLPFFWNFHFGNLFFYRLGLSKNMSIEPTGMGCFELAWYPIPNLMISPLITSLQNQWQPLIKICCGIHNGHQLQPISYYKNVSNVQRHVMCKVTWHQVHVTSWINIVSYNHHFHHSHHFHNNNNNNNNNNMTKISPCFIYIIIIIIIIIIT